MDTQTEVEGEKTNNDDALNNAEVESKEAASTDSTQSSDGKGSGGYSADYSDEDPSSDDTGTKEKPVEAAISVSGLRIADRKVENENRNKEENTSSDSLSSLEKTKKHKSSRQRKRPLGGSAKKGNDALESENTFGEFLKSLLSSGFLPQLNGVLISHPMDPRIDLSNVQYVPEAEIEAHQNDSTVDFQGLSEENYLQLMDSVRPFFRVQGVPLPDPPPQKAHEESSSDPVSSEGFTSFFTTTNTASSNDNTTHSADSSDSNKQQSDNKDKEQKKPNAPLLDASAQTKSKRKGEGAGGGGESSGSSQKRVRILEAIKSPTVSQDGANNRSNEQVNRERARMMAEANDSTTSSSSKSDEQMQITVPPRIVTDVSSSNRTDSAAGTSESAGNTGSASNQGSSGSGMDGKGSSEEGKGSSEEGKGSSEDNNNKRHGVEAGGSDETEFGNKVPGPAAAKTKVDSKSDSPQGDELREKLIHKKRKRIEMRREYEAQQHFESSESSGYNSESLFRPGKHVQMDQVLQVSNIPRLVIQAISPFMVVHANAAYSRLTGLEAHEVVGKSVSSILALPESASQVVERQTHRDAEHERVTAQDTPGIEGEVAETTPARQTTAERQRNEPSRFESLERLIVSCGFGHIQFVNAITANEHQMLGRNVTFLSGTQDTRENHAERDEGSNSTSLSSNDDVKVQLIPCRTAIAPIVSAQIPSESAPTEHDNDTKSKRRKHQHSGTGETTANKHNAPKDPPPQHRRHNQPQVITHYIIQLERLAAGGAKQLSVDDSISSNSTSVEARLAGVSKETLAQQKAAVAFSRESPIGLPGALGDDEASGSTQQEGMVAIG